MPSDAPGPGSVPGPVPGPRTPPGAGPALRGRRVPQALWARWYAGELGWPAEAGPPARLLTGVAFDALELPAEAGRETLRRMGAETGPVALAGRHAYFLVAPGNAEELPGLLDWLEWGGIRLDLRILGAGGHMTAPAPPAWRDGADAAVWLRAPLPDHGTESPLPALHRSPMGGAGGCPCLARLVATAAAACHRARLRDAARGHRPEPEPDAVKPAAPLKAAQRAIQRLASS